MPNHSPISHGIAGYVSQNGLMATDQYISAAPIAENLHKHVYATGGTETIVLEKNNGRRYRVHTYYSTADFNSYSIGPCEFVMVAGGGGGGGCENYGFGPGGSGGAGGARAAVDDVGAISAGHRKATALSTSVTVGHGGAAGGWSAQGGNGGSTSALGISTTGGGAGGADARHGGEHGNAGGNGGAPGGHGHNLSHGAGNAGGYTPSEANGGISPRTSSSHRITGTLAYYPGAAGNAGHGVHSSTGTAGGAGMVVIRYPIG